MSKQLEELKAKIAEHTKKHPQKISHKDLQGGPIPDVVVRKPVIIEPNRIEELMDDLEETVEELEEDLDNDQAH